MLVQWICGEVAVDQHSAFVELQQERLTALSKASGFVAQAGGVDSLHEEQISVLDFWQDRAAFETFHQKPQIELCGGPDQVCHLLSLSVFELSLSISGQYQDFFKAIAKSAVMRVAECTVKQACVPHFLEAQEKIWAPGLKKAGVLCAAVMRNVNNPSHHFVVSLWQNAATHKAYTLKSLPVLRSQSEILKDVDFIWGKLVNFTPDWLVSNQ